MTPLLDISELNTFYGQSHILQGVNLSVNEASAVALLGRNGAGKSTTLKSIMGITPPKSGSIVFAGTELTRLASHRIAREGIGYVPEERGIFASLSVEEHLGLMGRERSGGWTAASVYDAFPRLSERKHHGGAELSGGEQQMLSIARALMLNPRLLILDEPTEGLAPVVVEEIAGIITDLKQAGMTMLLVEQNYAFASSLADQVVVLGKGRVRFSGTGDALRQRPDIEHTWLGI